MPQAKIVKEKATSKINTVILTINAISGCIITLILCRKDIVFLKVEELKSSGVIELADKTIHKTLYHPQILPDSNTQKLLFSLTITSRFLPIFQN